MRIDEKNYFLLNRREEQENAVNQNHVRVSPEQKYCGICRKVASECKGRVIESYRDQKPVAFLSNWRIVSASNGIWAQLHGTVISHRKFVDGEEITTSPILKLDIPAGVAETMNTRYILEDRR